MRELTFLLALSLIPVFAESPKLAVDSARAAGDESIVQVRNISRVPATAFAVASSEKEFAMVDVLLGGREGHPLLPGETAEVKLPRGPAEGTPQVVAAVFEDGTTAGEQRWVERLLGARRSVSNDLPMALTLARHAITQSVQASSAAFWFHQWDDRYRGSHPGEMNPVWRAAEMVFQQAGKASAEQPARDLIRVFEELQSNLAQSKPALQ
jgi:hypothetical protein